MRQARSPSVDDIYRLHTFGFRGEALASIAAVAQVELRTRQADDEVGTRTLIEGGVFRSQEPMMCPVGSAFFVRNLFYKCAGPRRFMEDTARSGRSIRNEFERVALCNPGVAFELYNNNVPVHKLPAASLSGRIVDLEGKSLRNNLLEVSASTSLVRIEGLRRASGIGQEERTQAVFSLSRPVFQVAVFLQGGDEGL